MQQDEPTLPPPLPQQPATPPSRAPQWPRQGPQLGAARPSNRPMLIFLGGALGVLLVLCCIGTAVVGALGGNTSTGTGGNAGAAIAKATSTPAPASQEVASTATVVVATPSDTVAPVPTATATAAATATTHPSPTATPKPKPKPTPTPAKLTIQFTCAHAVDHSSGSVCVHTLPGATLSITITYCSHHQATSNSLKGTHTADSSGNYTWTWTPDTTCKGTATAAVTASKNGQTVSGSKQFTVS